MPTLARSALALLRRRPAFARLWVAGVVTQLGDWVGWVAISIYTLHTGGGALDLALVYAAHSLPTLLTLPLAGRLLDRVDARAALMGAATTMGLLTFGMVVAAHGDHLRVLQALLVARSMVDAAVRPAQRSAMPRLVRKDELLIANAFDASSWSVVFSAGMVLGGVLTGLGATTALAIDALSFLAAAMVFRQLPDLPPEPRTAVATREGKADDARDTPLWFATYAKTPLALAAGAGWMVIALRVDAWAAASLAFGWVHGARGVGAGLGSITAGWLGRRSAAWPALVGLGFVGFAGLAWASSVWLTALAAVAWGIGSGANWVFSGEAQQRLAPAHQQARVAARDTWSWTLAMCLGALAVAWVHDHTSGLAGAADTVLAAFALMGAAAWFLAWSQLRPTPLSSRRRQKMGALLAGTTPAATPLATNASTAARPSSPRSAENALT